VFPTALLDLDTAVLRIARTRGHAPVLEHAAAAYSRFGEHGACWLVIGLTGAALDPSAARRDRWRRGAGAVAGAVLLNYGVKLVVRRRRPELPDLPPLSSTVSRLSFPSAHATTSFTAARVFDGLAPTAALYAGAAAFALSRPYLGVHYPSDVIAGALLGTTLGQLAR
jgi:membrane-associated phospholipid phosphatase